MTCRRKTKSERELVADINKTFYKFCARSQFDDENNSCRTCRFRNVSDCKLEYLKELLSLYDEDKDEE